LAESTTDDATAESLGMLARDFEVQARQAENHIQPINRAV